MFQIEILKDHHQEEEEDHHAPQDRLREGEEEGAEVEEEGEEEHFRCLDTHLPNQLKNS